MATSCKAIDPGKSSTYGVSTRILVALAVITILVCGVGGWAVKADLAGAVITRGSVVIDRHSKRIQHRDGGIVAAIYVDNGDSVKENDIVLRLDETQVRAELAIVQAQQMELKGRRARLTAEHGFSDTIEFPEDLASQPGAQPIIDGERRLFVENRRMREGQEKQLRQRIEQIAQEKAGYAVQRNAKVNELALIRRELESARTLLRKSLTPVSKVIALEREETRIDGDRGSLIAQEARVSGQIGEIEQQILTLRQTSRAEAQKELRTVDARIDELKERQIAGMDRLSRMLIRAPQSGVVHELTAHTVGGVISPAEQVMLIVPDEEKLVVEIRVSPSEIDQIHVGQAARLRFTSFNQRTTPELAGTVSYISADTSRDPKEHQEFYVARVTVDGDKPDKVGEKPIVPGMPVEVYVTTESRTALTYFTKPLVDQFSRAFRER